MKKIGIMGGSFDPPHLGHIGIAKAAKEALGLSEVWFMPTGKVAYKTQKNGADALERLAMVTLAVEDIPHFCVHDFEAKSKEVTYTYKTLAHLKETYPDVAFTLIIGADSLDYMEKWKYPEQIFPYCTVAAVLRPGFSMAQMEEKAQRLKKDFGAQIVLVKGPEVPVSSTELRKRLYKGLSVSPFMDEKVCLWIKAHGLYQEG